MRDAGMQWLALNIGDGAGWDDWKVVVDRARLLDVKVFPWARCRTMTECYHLLAAADNVSFLAILNIENEFENVVSPQAVATLVHQFPELDVGISTLGWMYNDVDYRPLGHLPFLLQIFAQDMGREPDELQKIQGDCCTHARELGVTYVGVTYQTYGKAEPDWYAYWKGARSFYTGDDIGAGNWADWA